MVRARELGALARFRSAFRCFTIKAVVHGANIDARYPYSRIESFLRHVRVLASS
jgi:hypothetical protein